MKLQRVDDGRPKEDQWFGSMVGGAVLRVEKTLCSVHVAIATRRTFIFLVSGCGNGTHSSRSMNSVEQLLETNMLLSMCNSSWSNVWKHDCAWTFREENRFDCTTVRSFRKDLISVQLGMHRKYCWLADSRSGNSLRIPVTQSVSVSRAERKNIDVIDPDTGRNRVSERVRSDESTVCSCWLKKTPLLFLSSSFFCQCHAYLYVYFDGAL